MLNYIKLIEIVAMLRASVLPKIRKKYEEAVIKGNLSKERMVTYYSSLPSKNSVGIYNYSLRDFTAIGLAKGYVIEPATANITPVPAQDIIIALNELLPLVRSPLSFHFLNVNKHSYAEIIFLLDCSRGVFYCIIVWYELQR